MSVITGQTVHIVCGYLTCIDINCHTYDHFFVGNAGPLTNGVGGWGQRAIPLLFFFWKYVARLLSLEFSLVSFSKISQTNLVLAPSESRRGACISYLEFSNKPQFISTWRYWEWSKHDMIWDWKTRAPSWGRISIDYVMTIFSWSQWETLHITINLIFLKVVNI